MSMVSGNSLNCQTMPRVASLRDASRLDEEVNSVSRSCAKVWLETDRGNLLCLPLSADGDAPGVGALILSSSSAVGKEKTAAWDTLAAARWLMPSLSADLIAEVLQLDEATDGSAQPVD